MSFVRPTRRVAVAAVSLSAVLLAAACGGGGGNSSSGSGGSGGSGGNSASGGGVDLSKQGDTELWAGKDNTGNTARVVARFNAQHPNGKVKFHELPALADQQRQQMIQNDQIKNPKMGILSVDVVWTAEFAAKGLVIPLPQDKFPTTGMLKPVVDGATYFNKLYAYPNSTDGGMLYYRKDLLDKYKLSVPKTFDEIKASCKKIMAGENSSKMQCYAGQYNKYEGLTVNFAEAVNTAGGVIVGDDGKPNVSTPEAQKGLSFLVDSFKDGTIPKGAITWAEEEGRAAFQAGNLLYQRNWPYANALFSKNDGSSKVAGKYGIAPLPGFTADKPGVSSLGGHNYAIATNADAKGTAADFVKFTASVEEQKKNMIASSAAPVSDELYKDPTLVKKYPYLPILLKSVSTAKPRPKAVEYGDVTLKIQDAAYGALQGQTKPEAALQNLQSQLQTLIKQ